MTSDEAVAYIEGGIRLILEAVDKERAHWAWAFSNGQIHMAENIGIIRYDTVRDLRKKTDEFLDAALDKLQGEV